MGDKMDNVEKVLKRHRRRLQKKENISKSFTKVLLSIIFILLSCIFFKLDDNNKQWFKENIFENSLLFTKINNIYEKYFGSIIPKTGSISSVSSSPSFISSKEKYYDGYRISSNKSEPVNTIQSGLLVYLGEKEHFGKVAIIQGVDGVDIWYGGITDINYKMYDYIEKGIIIGNTEEDHYYLVLKKENNYLSYEEYINEA